MPFLEGCKELANEVMMVGYYYVSSADRFLQFLLARLVLLVDCFLDHLAMA